VRQFSGVWCTEWNGSGLNPPYQIDSGFSNANGWLAAENGDTVRGVWYGAGGWPPIACGRGYWGASCTNGFSTSAFSTPSGWNQPYFYETIRYIDLKQNGRVDVCGRGAGGIVCTVSNGSSWGPATLWTPAYDNVNGWTDMTNASTIQFADISGDGKLDVCGRSDYGMLCSVADRFVDSFINTHYWSFDNDRTGLTTTQRDFADSDLGINWASSASYYDSIRLVDVNRDGFADACGRGPQGIYCALSTGTSFERKKLVAPDVTDVGGWGAANTGGTLSFGDLNASARVDACLRGNAGIYCTEGY
jgi:hypothetical protein